MVEAARRLVVDRAEVLFSLWNAMIKARLIHLTAENMLVGVGGSEARTRLAVNER